MDAVVSLFNLRSNRDSLVPMLEFGYREQDTGAEWYITAGGTRIYLSRYAESLDDDLDEQAADSHFMVRRVTSALLLAGYGLFRSEPRGRVQLFKLGDDAHWVLHLNHPTPEEAQPERAAIERFNDWLEALCEHTVLRRAADDAYLALAHPHEAPIFVYRGLEWLKKSEGRTWKNLAEDMGVSKSSIKGFKKLANYDTGMRHGGRSGKKLRASVENYGTWVCGLIDALNATRARAQPKFEPMIPELVAAAVRQAMPMMPYP